MYDICIIGAGASGMMAAVTAKRENNNAKIIVLEKLGVPGKKLGVTGNGRCNISNINCKNHAKVLEVFKSIGVLTRIDGEGRLYPYSEDAKDVVTALTSAMSRLGVRVKCGDGVASAGRNSEGFEIITEAGSVVKSRKLLIAAGGKAGPKFGTVGDGTKLAKAFGHEITRLAPSLTGIEVYEDISHLSGLREKCKASLFLDGKTVREESGEIQFTKYGISGICAFNLSKYIKIPEGEPLKEGFKRYGIKIDFLPDIENGEAFLKERKSLLHEDYMVSLVKGALAKYVGERASKDVRKVSEMLKAFSLTPKNLRGWEFAQVTSGGVRCEDVDFRTMESKLVEGLYFSGEVMDYDGICGGYNLQYAWETGIKAGKYMAICLKKCE
ncbi:MAG: aminoacetone oxidase family FAD-binding enzyme [Hornefia sp.]|nr:aminoacetone oxidase family FAD-binding enzyme [Hornefia sp.]